MKVKCSMCGHYAYAQDMWRSDTNKSYHTKCWLDDYVPVFGKNELWKWRINDSKTCT